jgi:iron complex transport system ATP-binding protein
MMTCPAGSIALEARHVSFSYARPVVSDLALQLRAGQVTGIIGPNGAGKTTVLRLMDGILRPTSGEVFLNAQVPLSRLRRKEIARAVALVPQNGGLHQPMTVFEFAMQGRSPHLPFLGFETEEDEGIVLRALELTGLAGMREAGVSEISGGEKQRLLLARALAQDTQVLLLDELTANLDINYQIELMRLVCRSTHEKGLATLVVSHEIHLLTSFCDELVLMADGRIRLQGPVNDVVSEDTLSDIFGIGFSVRKRSGIPPEIIPIIPPRDKQ